MPGHLTTETWSDAELARAWAEPGAGLSRAAFDEAYRRFAPTLYGTAVGLLRDRERAADVVQDTFLRAATRVGGLREPDRLRAWLFAILRNEVVSAHRAQGRVVASLDEPESTVTASMADGARAADVLVSAGELAELVDAASQSLQDRDREVLELHLRAGLDSAEIAAVLGVPAAHGAVLLSRMRDRLATALGSLLVARAGRRDCAQLARLLDGWDGRFTLDLRSKVTRHVESCSTCTQRRSALFTPQHLAPAVVLPAVLLPWDLRDRIGMRLTSSSLPLSGPGGPSIVDDWQWRDDGFPWPADPDDALAPFADDAPGRPPARRGPGGGFGGGRGGGPGGLSRRTLVAGAAVVVLLGAGTGVFLSRQQDTSGPQALVLASGSAQATAGPSTSSDVVPPAPTGSATDLPTGSPATGTPASTRTATGPATRPTSSASRSAGPATGAATPSIAPGTTPPAPTSQPDPTTQAPPDPSPPAPSPTRSSRAPSPTPTPTPTPTPPLRIVRVAVSPSTVESALPPTCAGGTVTVSVVATGADPLAGTVTWTQSDGSRASATLSPNGNGLRGTAGPFLGVGTLPLDIVVTDSAGQRASTKASVNVTLCQG